MPCRSASCCTTKPAEEHYNLISALHKSVRNSDPDAALYWLGRMLEAGEDPLYIARRVVRMAVEDVGLADPAALSLCMAARDAVDFIGMPEGNLALRRRWCTCRSRLSRMRSTPPRRRPAGRRTDCRRARPAASQECSTQLMKGLGYGRTINTHTSSRAKWLTCNACLTTCANVSTTIRTNEGMERAIRERLDQIKRLRRAKPGSTRKASSQAEKES